MFSYRKTCRSLQSIRKVFEACQTAMWFHQMQEEKQQGTRGSTAFQLLSFCPNNAIFSWCRGLPSDLEQWGQDRKNTSIHAYSGPISDSLALHDSVNELMWEDKKVVCDSCSQSFTLCSLVAVLNIPWCRVHHRIKPLDLVSSTLLHSDWFE